MKTAFGAAAIAWVLSSSGVAAQSAPPSPERELQPLLDELMLAANAHDTDRFLTSYLHDSTLVFVFNGAVTRGFNNLRDLQLKWWHGGKSDVVYSQHGTADFMVLTPGVVVVTEPLLSQRTDSTGVVKTGEFAVTMVWQKRAAGWRIVAAHESTVR